MRPPRPLRSRGLLLLLPRPSGTILSSVSAARPRTPRVPPRASPCAAIPRRHASSSSAAAATQAGASVARNLALSAAFGAFAALGLFYVTDTRASAHRWLVVPALRYLCPDPEDAHVAGNRSLKALYAFGLHPRERGDPDAGGDLEVEVFGHVLSNPLATSAGLDKNCEIPSPLLAIGPAVVEVGGVTPLPQDGNPRPRVFRLESFRGLLNRYGLNSDGADAVAMRLRQRVREYAFANGFGLDEPGERRVLDGDAGVPPGSLVRGKLLAVQIAKNKATPDDDLEAVVADYVYCTRALGRYADLITINVSSPNTPGLRSFQKAEPLTRILAAVVDEAARVDRRSKPKVLVKVSPDEDSEDQVRGICRAVLDSDVAGVIVANTTKQRPSPPTTTTAASAAKPSPRELQTLEHEQGGYSGPQLFERTVRLVRRYRELLDGATLAKTAGKDDEDKEEEGAKGQSSPTREKKNEDGAQHKVIFASGGITNGSQALEVLNAGASVSMVYTALALGGLGTITRMKNEMREELRKKANG